MKKGDFFKYCEFIFDTLFEFDRRHNFISDKDVFNYLNNYYPKYIISRHMRIQGFLSERLSTIFFKHNFKRIKTFPIVTLQKNLVVIEGKKKENIIQILNYFLEMFF